jgi:potassium efflux system protein
VLILLLLPVWAEEPDFGLLSETWLQQRIAAVEVATDLSASERERAVDRYRQALAHYQQAERDAENQRRYRRALTAAPAETEQLRQQLDELQQQPEWFDPMPALLSLEELESLLTHQLAEQTALRARLSELETQKRIMEVRPEQIPTELEETRVRLADLGNVTDLATVSLDTVLEHAQATVHSAQALMLNQRIAMLEQEALSHEERLTLLQARHDVLEQQLAVQSRHIVQLQTLINERRQQKAAEALRETERVTRDLADRPEVLRRAAELNTELSQQLNDVVQLTETVAAAGQRNVQLLQQLDERFSSIQRQLDIAGMSEALGPILRNERRQLPDISQYRQNAQERQQRLVEARLQQFRFEQQRRQLANLDEAIEQRLATLPNLDPQQLAELREALRELLRNRRQLLELLGKGYAAYVDRLLALDQVQRQLIDSAERHAELLDQKLFWIASSAPVDLQWSLAFANGLQWLLTPVHWSEVGQTLVTFPWFEQTLLGLTALIAILLLAYRRRLLRRLNAMDQAVGKVQYDRFMLTLQALFITLALALPWPLLMGVPGKLLLVNEQLSEFTRGVGNGLYATAVFLMALALLRQLCRPNGLAVLHFRWSEQTCQVIRRNLHWFMPIGGVSAFVVMLTEWQPDELYRDTLGRLAFVVGTLAFTLLLARLLHPSRGTLGGLLSGHGMAWRLRFVWYPAVIALPLVMLVLALMGFYYTALQLQERLVMTVTVLVAVVVITYLVLRLLNVLQRRVALEQALSRRDALRAARSKEHYQALETTQAVQEAEATDIEAVGEQTRALLQISATIAIGVGMWWIWSDLLPALTFLDQVVLWEQTTVDETGQSQLTAITLGSLVLALVLLLLLQFVARNLPGVMEITILRHLGMDGGIRYAMTTITRYSITIISIFMALNILGVNWSQAQWLVAALGVGLGFGLQEIFANFVSGLILLLERPIRVGDTVTIDGHVGTVSRIRIRATTLTDWDNMEIVIPNKTFITGTLINWTLTESVTRVIIPVRVRIDADLEEVRAILLETTENHHLVLEDPEPVVYLLTLGESSVTFEIRAFVPDIIDRLPFINDLYLAIIQRLRDQGVEVPFPQHDLHIRSFPVNHPGSAGVIVPEELPSMQ